MRDSLRPVQSPHGAAMQPRTKDVCLARNTQGLRKIGQLANLEHAWEGTQRTFMNFPHNLSRWQIRCIALDCFHHFHGKDALVRA